MASAIKEEISEHGDGGSSSHTQGLAEMEDEEEELFEINLEAVNCIPPPHYWEAFFTATSSALLANCLLPISDLSSAIPTVSTTCSTFFQGRTDQCCHGFRFLAWEIPLDPINGGFWGTKRGNESMIQTENQL